MNKVIYILIKNNLINIMMIALFAIVFIRPEIVTKYGIQTKAINYIVRIFTVFLFFISLIPMKGLIIDTYGFLRHGSSYIKEANCTVIRETHTVWFPFIQRSIYCKDSQHFIDRFTLSFYHKGEKYKIIYLPKTKLIVDKNCLDK